MRARVTHYRRVNRPGLLTEAYRLQQVALHERESRVRQEAERRRTYGPVTWPRSDRLTPVTCALCDGDGVEPGYGPIMQRRRCGRCRGIGSIQRRTSPIPGRSTIYARPHGYYRSPSEEQQGRENESEEEEAVALDDTSDESATYESVF